MTALFLSKVWVYILFLSECIGFTSTCTCFMYQKILRLPIKTAVDVYGNLRWQTPDKPFINDLLHTIQIHKRN